MYSEEGNESKLNYYSDPEEVFEDAEEEEEEEEGVEAFEGEQEEEEEVEKEPIGEAGSSLLGRLWDTKVISWDTSASTNLAEPDISNEDVDGIRILKQGDEALRHSALLLQCSGFSEMSTGIILQVLSEAFDSAVEPIEKPVGLEWVDDSTVVILWSSEFGSRQAFLHLTGALLDEDFPLEALPCIIGNHEATVRLALASDVKRKGAAAKSQYYRKRQESRQPYSTSGRPSRARKEDLDAELDQMRNASPSRVVEVLDALVDAMAKDRDTNEVL